MSNKATAAMKEGVKNSKYFVAVISGACVNNDSPNDAPETNAYFRRPFCIKELRWAQEAGKFIQPILRLEDKGKIGEFLGLLDAPLKVDGQMQDISDLRCLGNTEWMDLNRNNQRFWDLGMEIVHEALENAPQFTASTSTLSIDRAHDKEISELKKQLKKEHIEKTPENNELEDNDNSEGAEEDEEDDDEEEEGDLTMQEKTDKKLFQVINSMVDTTLKGGFGLPGAVVSILKNAIIEYKKQEDRGFLADDSKG
jgi:hypothetical protein